MNAEQFKTKYAKSAEAGEVGYLLFAAELNLSHEASTNLEMMKIISQVVVEMFDSQAVVTDEIALMVLNGFNEYDCDEDSWEGAGQVLSDVFSLA